MGDTDIYLVPTFKATFDDLYINAKLLDNLTLQLFLPKDFIDASSRIEKVEGKDTQVGYAIMVGGNKANTQADMFTIGGKAYNSFVKYANYAAIITEWPIVIEYTVEFNGKDYKLSREFEATSNTASIFLLQLMRKKSPYTPSLRRVMSQTLFALLMSIL